MKAELVSFGLMKGSTVLYFENVAQKNKPKEQKPFEINWTYRYYTLEVMYEVCLTAALTMIHMLKYQILPPNIFCFLTNDSELILFYRKQYKSIYIYVNC